MAEVLKAAASCGHLAGQDEVEKDRHEDERDNGHRAFAHGVSRILSQELTASAAPSKQSPVSHGGIPAHETQK